MSPAEVYACELWEVAAVLGRNEPEQREPWPDDAPDIRVLRRLLARNQGRIAPHRDEPIGDEEYAELLAMAKSGTRKEVRP